MVAACEGIGFGCFLLLSRILLLLLFLTILLFAIGALRLLLFLFLLWWLLFLLFFFLILISTCILCPILFLDLCLSRTVARYFIFALAGQVSNGRFCAIFTASVFLTVSIIDLCKIEIFDIIHEASFDSLCLSAELNQFCTKCIIHDITRNSIELIILLLLFLFLFLFAFTLMR